MAHAQNQRLWHSESGSDAYAPAVLEKLATASASVLNTSKTVSNLVIWRTSWNLLPRWQRRREAPCDFTLWCAATSVPSPALSMKVMLSILRTIFFFPSAIKLFTFSRKALLSSPSTIRPSSAATPTDASKRDNTATDLRCERRGADHPAKSQQIELRPVPARTGTGLTPVSRHVPRLDGYSTVGGNRA